ncbi:MAG: toxin-activating lysine-acyltransferase [Rhodospirillales bacterium]|nr:toxin-activating lysine-acyltransferase [Rhodospirillales bacterium]
MKCRKLKEPFQALGVAINVLRRVSPYANYPFGKLSNVLMGQVRRGHYVFTFDDEGTPVGYVGWALCDEEIARKWMEGEYVPSSEECKNGDCGLVVTFYAANKEALLAQTRYCREKYPNIKVFGIRDYGNGDRLSEVFNRIDSSPEQAAEHT